MGEKLIGSTHFEAEGRAIVLDEKGLSVRVVIPEHIKAIMDLAIEKIPTLKAVYWSNGGQDIWVIFERLDEKEMFPYFDLERKLRRQAESPLNDIRCVVAEWLRPNSRPIEGSIPNAQDGYYFLQWAPFTPHMR